MLGGITNGPLFANAIQEDDNFLLDEPQEYLQYIVIY